MIFDVIVVGAGVVGLTLALELGRAGLTVAVLEKQSLEYLNHPIDLSQYDKRVFTINSASQALFQSVGAWDGMQALRVSPYQSMEVWDACGSGEIQFNVDLGKFSELGHIIEQKVILKALGDQLKYYDSIQVIAPCELSHFTLSESVSNLYLKEEGGLKRLQTSLIVGADGANSWVRTQAGLEVKGWSYGQTALVATIHTEKSHGQTARQRFALEGPLALLPLADPHICSIVWMIDPLQAENLAKMPAEEFSHILTRSFGPALGALTLSEDNRATFPLKMQQATGYCQPGCALVGDAAHVIHPLAGLGVNLGLQNVKVLSEFIKQQKDKQRMLGHFAYLKKYERQEKMRSRVVIAAMEGFKRGFGTDNSLVKHLRNAGLNLVDKQPLLKKWFVDFAMGK